nr:hypothetical protein Iba_chr14eCG8130 [Ipomoea batatas]
MHVRTTTSYRILTGSRCDGDRVFKGVSIDEGDDFSGVEIAAVLEETIVVGIPFGSGGVWAWSTSMSHFEQSGPPGPILKVEPVPVPDPDIGFASGTKSVPEPDPKLNPEFDPGFASGTKSVFEPEPMFEPDPKLKPGSMPGTTSASGTKSDPVLVDVGKGASTGVGAGADVAVIADDNCVGGNPIRQRGVWAWSTSMSHFEQSGPPGPILKVEPVPVPDPDIGFASGTKSVPEPDPKLNPEFDPGFASGTKSVFEPEPMFEPDPKLKPGSMPGTTSASGTKSDPVLVL